MDKHKTQSMFVIFLITSFFSILQPLWGQRDTAVITGTVRDTTGSLVPQVKITVTNALTNVQVFTTTSDEAGRYTVPALKASEYVITAELEGFKKEVRRGIQLEVNQVAVVDLTLQVGEVTEVVEVIEAAPLMRTETAELGDVVEQRRIVELPLNGRFFVNLVALTGGVNPPAPVQNPNNNVFLGARAGQPGVQVNGQRACCLS